MLMDILEQDEKECFCVNTMYLKLYSMGVKLKHIAKS